VTTFPGSALTVNIYGDSITEASNNLVTEGFYPEQVMQSHIGGRIGDRYVNNNGTSGNTIQQCDSNARGDIVEALAYPGTKAKRVIVFQCGTNSEGDGAAAVWAIINTLVLDSIDAGVRILPATITPYVARDPFIQGVNTRMKNVFTDAGIPWCDTYHDMEFPADSGILNPAYDFGDNIHVRAAGAQAEAVAWYNCGRDAGYWPRRALPLRGAHWDVRHTRRVERRKASGE
jgi:lysophospholipase L1-like esterase